MKIMERNDNLRKSLRSDHQNKVVLTSSVYQSDDKEKILELVRTFDDFNKDNDPYKEHDFGMVMFNKQTYYFKFDYYDLNMEYGVDPHTDEYILVLTIMHSSEY